MVHFAFAIHYEKLEDTNAMIRSRKTMKEKQYNEQRKYSTKHYAGKLKMERRETK
jgi:hypothetical protein